jgi:hypothetical protein
VGLARAVGREFIDRPTVSPDRDSWDDDDEMHRVSTDRARRAHWDEVFTTDWRYAIYQAHERAIKEDHERDQALNELIDARHTIALAENDQEEDEEDEDAEYASMLFDIGHVEDLGPYESARYVVNRSPANLEDSSLDEYPYTLRNRDEAHWWNYLYDCHERAIAENDKREVALPDYPSAESDDAIRGKGHGVVLGMVGFEFGAELIVTPSALGTSMLTNWDNAVALVSNNDRVAVLDEWLRLHLAPRDVDEIIHRLRYSQMSRSFSMAELAVSLSPQAAPMYLGRPADVGSLRGLAEEALAADAPDEGGATFRDQDLLRLLESEILLVLARLQGASLLAPRSTSFHCPVVHSL